MKNNEFSQGRFKIEFPEEMDQDEIDMIRTMVFRLLERHSCRVILLDDKEKGVENNE